MWYLVPGVALNMSLLCESHGVGQRFLSVHIAAVGMTPDCIVHSGSQLCDWGVIFFLLTELWMRSEAAENGPLFVLCECFYDGQRNPHILVQSELTITADGT